MPNCNQCNGTGKVNVVINQIDHNHNCVGNEMRDGDLVGRCNHCGKLCGNGNYCYTEDIMGQVNCGNCNETGKRGGSYEKYLKYKNKYLELKKRMN